MGKKVGSSWLSAVKRAFRSPTKHQNHQESDPKKRDRRRWIFRKSPSVHQNQSPGKTDSQRENHIPAASEVLTASVNRTDYPRDQRAAIAVQTAFRGYLARRALRALKGLVKLQALVRGHNVRKQAKMTLRCMQALVRVQSRMLNQRVGISNDGNGSRKSTLSDTYSLWESRYLQDIADRKSISQSRDGSSIADGWDECTHTIDEVKAMLQSRKEANLRREMNSSPLRQVRRGGGRNRSVGNEDDLVPPRYLENWKGRGRASTGQRDPIKTVEIDTSQPFTYLAPNFPQKILFTSPYRRSSSQPSATYATPSPSKTKPVQARSASPRLFKDDGSHQSYETNQTPSLRSNYYYSGALSQGNGRQFGNALPNYMAETESAKARNRSQSVPRNRPLTPERDRGIRKRLSYPVPQDPYGRLRSPSFKSVCGSRVDGVMMEQQSNYSSCCTGSIGGEFSPCSNARRWNS